MQVLISSRKRSRFDRLICRKFFVFFCVDMWRAAQCLGIADADAVTSQSLLCCAACVVL